MQTLVFFFNNIHFSHSHRPWRFGHLPRKKQYTLGAGIYLRIWGIQIRTLKWKTRFSESPQWSCDAIFPSLRSCRRRLNQQPKSALLLVSSPKRSIPLDAESLDFYNPIGLWLLPCLTPEIISGGTKMGVPCENEDEWELHSWSLELPAWVTQTPIQPWGAGRGNKPLSHWCGELPRRSASPVWGMLLLWTLKKMGLASKICRFLHI